LTLIESDPNDSVLIDGTMPGSSLAVHAGRLVANGDGDARQHAALRVEHAPSQLGRPLLRPSRHGQQQQHTHCPKESMDHAKPSQTCV
jgi:hypothetical protein